ncbi:MAG: DUF1579 family protein [Planctomycetota bacterium]
MTRHRPCRFLVLVCAVPLVAQQSAVAPERALLQEMAGTWKVTSSGMATAAAKAVASEQLEVAELVCGGLWLQSVTYAGNNEMHWLTGCDPARHSFVRVRVSGTLEAVVEDGEFDAVQRTITWRGRSATARKLGLLTVLALPQGEPPTERLFRGAPAGKPLTERVFERTKAEVPAVAPGRPTIAPEHELLTSLAGEWQCAITATMPGMAKPMRSTGRMCDSVLTDGCWLRSVFESEFGGSRIEGRGLMGFDKQQRRYVRFWVDSGSPVLAISTCTLDEAGKKLVGTGTLQMPDGEVTVAEEVELGIDQRRVIQRLQSADGKDAGTFEMVLTRRPATKPK